VQCWEDPIALAKGGPPSSSNHKTSNPCFEDCQEMQTKSDKDNTNTFIDANLHGARSRNSRFKFNNGNFFDIN
jgi:hypothetical protein